MSSLSVLLLLFCLGASTATLEPTPSPYPLTTSSPSLQPASSATPLPKTSSPSMLQPTPSPTPSNSPSSPTPTLQPTPSTAPSNTITAYDVLATYGLPVGLLPQGVIGYDLDNKSGKFSAYLNVDGICSFSVAKYEFRVLSTVTGYLSRDRLHKIQGLYVKILFVWVDVHDVKRLDDGKLVISSGFFTWIIIPVDNYRVSPSCST